MLLPTGEAVRNFLYSGGIKTLSQHARVTVLSVVTDPELFETFRGDFDQWLRLEAVHEKWIVSRFRYLVHEAHFRWLWSKVAQNVWAIRDLHAKTLPVRLRRLLWKITVRALAYRPVLEQLTRVERSLTLALRPNDAFDRLFEELQPDLVFNTSHVHGPAADLPIRVAQARGIPTATSIFSWDNLTSRSRIFPAYDHFFVWHHGMRDQLLRMYPDIRPDQVTISGTPQFDLHMQKSAYLDRATLARAVGADPARPWILYTTGIPKHFPEEHRTVEAVARMLGELPVERKPQLLVRVYAKGNSEAMRTVMETGLPDTVFPPVLWRKEWLCPLPQDPGVYTSLLRECALGINAASTVSLELMMFDKPVINLGFDPPGTSLPKPHCFERHLYFDHYKPVTESGAVRVAKSLPELRELIEQALLQPQSDSARRKQLIHDMFGETLDGRAGARIAAKLVALASTRKPHA